MITGPESIVVGSEFFLSLYPILIKLVPVGLPTQLAVRFGTFAGAAAVPATSADFAAVFGSAAALGRTALAGALTLAHTYTSYAAFATLSAGVSMSLFYTYPLWNYLGAKFLFGEPLQGQSLPFIALGLLGTFLVSTRGFSDEVGGLVKAPLGAGLGIAAALAAALTESAMYFVVKERDVTTPWQSLLELYGGAAAWLLLLVPLLGLKINASAANWAKMIGFNVAVGFVGYAARYYAVPRVNTENFGLLSFAGVLSAFLFGWLLVGERPSIWTLVGAALILVAMSQIESLQHTN
jgi:drug/metabolite transporter (DMT)-like permease